MMKKKQLKNYLKSACRGRSNQITSVDLRKTAGLSDMRLKELVSQLRQEGVPVASDQHGYWYASTAGDIYATIQFLKRIEAGLQATIRGLERSLDNFR